MPVKQVDYKKIAARYYFILKSINSPYAISPATILKYKLNNNAKRKQEAYDTC